MLDSNSMEVNPGYSSILRTVTFVHSLNLVDIYPAPNDIKVELVPSCGRGKFGARESREWVKVKTIDYKHSEIKSNDHRKKPVYPIGIIEVGEKRHWAGHLVFFSSDQNFG